MSRRAWVVFALVAFFTLVVPVIPGLLLWLVSGVWNG
jgi:hypothetical protein